MYYRYYTKNNMFNTYCYYINIYIAFVGYYVFFVNIGRNKFSWSKFEHKSDVPIKADNV